MSIILKVKNLVTKFHTFDGVVHALNKVSFHLNEGETLAIVGESGSGKSVTMMSLLHLLPSPPAKVEGGRALFNDNGKEIDLLKLSKKQMFKIRGGKLGFVQNISDIRGGKIGFIFQDAMSALNPVLTIGAQVMEPITEHLKLNRESAKKRAIEMLELVGIADPERRFDNYPHQLSGGMRQRAMIALAISCNPKVLIADEPTTALDVTIQAQVIEVVKKIQRDLNISVIWITHDLSVVAGMADRVLVMYAGSSLEEAIVDDLFEKPAHPYTAGLLDALPRMDSGHDRRLASIEGSPPDLLIKPKHCQFAFRCSYAFEKCWKEIPELLEIADGHSVACFYDMEKGEPVR